MPSDGSSYCGLLSPFFGLGIPANQEYIPGNKRGEKYCDADQNSDYDLCVIAEAILCFARLFAWQWQPLHEFEPLGSTLTPELVVHDALDGTAQTLQVLLNFSNLEDNHQAKACKQNNKHSLINHTIIQLAQRQHHGNSLPVAD